MILAPLRGVTIRCFRETFAEQIREAGFTEAITPFLSARSRIGSCAERPTKSKSLRSSSGKIQNLCARAFYG